MGMVGICLTIDVILKLTCLSTKVKLIITSLYATKSSCSNKNNRTVFDLVEMKTYPIKTMQFLLRNSTNQIRLSLEWFEASRLQVLVANVTASIKYFRDRNRISEH